MALNKFMHPRNIYKTPPDFRKLAKTYEDFLNIAKVEINGKVSIDFKNPHTLRVLTKCLLKSDFNLDVVIPEDRLVPTLPLRLNYILWVEDLMNTINRCNPIYGLDIGTGACAIYPLLAAVKNKWHMVGTEVDNESLQQARNNVKRNNLEHLIEVRENTTKSVIEHMFLGENSPMFDFCMCNPPFYTNIQELWESRSPARPEPKNGFTGSPHELITEGGELQFCRKIIVESKLYKDKVLIYTTMVGHKLNLKELVTDLKAEGITYTTTEFCQGRVTRWGLAWTYQNYDFSKMSSPRDKTRKKNVPILFTLPHVSECNDYIKKLKGILQELQIIYKVVNKRKTELILNIFAFSNTWSNQRRKRRIQKRLAEDQIKKAKLGLENLESPNKSHTSTNDLSYSIVNESSRNNDTLNRKLEDKTGSQKLLISTNELLDTIVDKISKPAEENKINNENIKSSLEDKTGPHKSQKSSDQLNDTVINTNSKPAEESKSKNETLSGSLKDNTGSSTNKLCDDIIVNKSSEPVDIDKSNETFNHLTQDNAKIAIVHALMKIANKDKLVNIEMEFLSGSAGKEGIHQIVQYIKNNWK